MNVSVSWKREFDRFGLCSRDNIVIIKRVILHKTHAARRLGVRQFFSIIILNLSNSIMITTKLFCRRCYAAVADEVKIEIWVTPLFSGGPRSVALRRRMVSANGGVMGAQVVKVGGGRGGRVALRLVVVRGRIGQRVEERRPAGGRRPGRPRGRHRRAVHVQPGVLLLPLGPPVLEPYFHLGLGERQRQREVQPLAHGQVPRGLELVLQRHQLFVRERRAGPPRFPAAAVLRTAAAAASASAAAVIGRLWLFRPAAAAAGRRTAVATAFVPVVAYVAAAAVAAHADVLVVLVHHVVARTVFACEKQPQPEISYVLLIARQSQNYEYFPQKHSSFNYNYFNLKLTPTNDHYEWDTIPWNLFPNNYCQ